MGSPWSQSGNPSGNLGAESLVLGTEGRLKGRFFIREHKKVKEQPHETAVPDKARISQNQTLAENRAGNRDIHGIADVAVQAGNNQMASWENGRRRADALHGETSE